MFKRVTTLVLAFLTFSLFSVGYSANFSDEDLTDVNRISRMIGKPHDEKAQLYLKTKIDSSNEVVSAIAITALYVHDQKTYKKQLFDALSVNDYAERKKGNYNIVPFRMMQQLTKAIDQRAKGDKDDERIIILIDFMDLKKKDMWVDIMGDKVSLARFLRGMYLGDCLQSTKVDAERLANQIDKYAQKQKT